MKVKRPIGFWILMIIAVFILLILLSGQMMAFIDYEFTVSLGLQESEFAVGKTGVAVNKAFGVGDTMIYLPLLIAGLLDCGLERSGRFYNDSCFKHNRLLANGVFVLFILFTRFSRF